jgi:regulator of nucleoside diphosphate kinase
MEQATAMPIGILPEITITQRDHNRLHSMIGNYAPIISWKAAEFLLGELGRARIVDPDGIPPTTATMSSQIEFEDETTRKSRVVTLAYPEECVIYRDSLSILTPLGTALLGLSNGQSMSYRDRDGSLKTIRMRKVLHQPEAGRAFRQSPRMR